MPYNSTLRVKIKNKSMPEKNNIISVYFQHITVSYQATKPKGTANTPKWIEYSKINSTRIFYKVIEVLELILLNNFSKEIR